MSTADTAGFDPHFLGSAAPLPEPSGSRELRNLPYMHFSVLLDPGRRLAAATAVNIDGSALQDLGRGDDWHLDPRVPESEQAGAELYARNDLDRGHLVRRRDPVWGPDAARANVDTFCYTNAAPQAAEFNQSKELWNGLEDHVLAYADSNRLRLSVYTGPVFADNDPLYRGVQIPLQFWKIAAWADPNGVLAAAGFLLDQTPELDDIDLRQISAGSAPPLGPFKTFQVPVLTIADLTGLRFGPLVEADRLPASTTALPSHVRIRLRSLEDVRLAP